MKIEWFFADVTTVGSLDAAERVVSGVIVAGCVFGKSRSFLWLRGDFVA